MLWATFGNSTNLCCRNDDFYVLKSYGGAFEMMRDGDQNQFRKAMTEGLRWDIFF